MRRIGFDAVRALRNSTGLGNYARRVLEGLAAQDAGIEAVLYSSRAPRLLHADVPRRLGAALRLPPAAWRAPLARSLWRSFRLGRQAAKDGVVLYHGLSHEIPRDLPGTGIPSVVSFLDLLWEQFPKLYPVVDRRSYRWRYRWSAERASAIVAVSRQTRNDLVERYAIDPSRVVVIPPPCDPRFGLAHTDTERQEVLRRYGLPQRFLLSVGTLEPRKNQRTAIAALARLDPATTPPLVLVGRDAGMRAELLEFAARRGVEERLHTRSSVPSAALPVLMQSAALFLYPSLSEGFGLPIVEALAAGVPVIASEGGCFPEAGGPGTLYAPATDSAGFAALIRAVLDDPERAERMRRAGERYAAGFDGGALAGKLLELYDAVLRGAPLPADFSPRTALEPH